MQGNGNQLKAVVYNWTVSVARKIPFDDPQILLYVRVAYVVVQVIILGTYYYVSMKVYCLL
jgi:hypothetical protein